MMLVVIYLLMFCSLVLSSPGVPQAGASVGDGEWATEDGKIEIKVLHKDFIFLFFIYPSRQSSFVNVSLMIINYNTHSSFYC